MRQTVYSFIDYKGFLQHQIEANKAVKGYKSRMAEAAGCKLSYLSQSLNGPVHLMQEHACGLAVFWALSSEETQYFIDLVSYARAGTKQLRRVLTERLTATRDAQQKITKRIASTAISDEVQQKSYYSAWYISALHVLISIERYQTAEALAARLGIPAATVNAGLRTLQEMGGVMSVGGRWQVKGPPIHLPRESPYFAQQHLQWRMRAGLDASRQDSLHYTGVHSLSHADFARIKELLSSSITSAHEIVRASPEEEAVCLVCDLFPV